ncbi:hypothetical protein B0A55_03865 [Friedmanniomyces simplex]|uniref:RCC1/BLIP-II n=1 Tax=Friedmanniomyces simplex TaxID=329884 RepID=A0A4U0XFQ8_9PEZI|nr:hypothetical protein B0A55_03865 [Friedmanniomyces simplex]
MATSQSGSPGHSTILCAGLNAHSQLQEDTTDDIHKLRPIELPSDRREGVDVLFSGWSNTVLQSGNRIWSQGFQKLDATITANENGIYTHSAFGDHNGLLGLMSPSGDVTLVAPGPESGTSTLQPTSTDSSPQISHIALTGTDRIAITFRQAPNGRLCHVAEFENLEKFLSWYRDPSDAESYPDKHHMLPGRPKQLLGNMLSFLLLMEGGEVYSWGDARYQSLGRAVVGEGATAAGKPGVVEALGGLKIVKVATGGWLSAAVSEDHALYLWGAASEPGCEGSIKCLQEAGAGEVALVGLPAEAHSEPLDVVDRTADFTPLAPIVTASSV